MRTAIPLSELRPLWAVMRRLLPWVLRHPFVVSPLAWSLALVGWFAAAAAVATAEAALPYSGAALAIVLLLLLAGLFGWRRLAASSERPVVFLAPFEPATPGAREASLLHSDTLRARLDGGELQPHAEVRLVPAPVSRRDAERLLNETGASAVMFGRVKSIGAEATWEAELLARWPGDDSNQPTHIQEGAEGLVAEMYDRRERAPSRHELVIEPRAPVGRLIGERFDSDHADRLEGTLLALFAAELAEYDEDGCRRCLSGADNLRSKLSERTRASLEVTRAQIQFATSQRSVLDALESAGQRDANHPDLWNFLVGIGYFGVLAGDVSEKEFLRYAEQAVAADPDEPLARYNLGEALMAVGRPEEALREFDRIADDPDYAERPYLHFARGMLSYNLGRYDEAREAYERAVELQPTARAYLYLGDAYRQLGFGNQARQQYLAALHLQPDLVDAHRGYWYQSSEQELQQPPSSFDRNYFRIMRLPGFGRRRWRRPVVRWLLRRHLRQHPEDSRIHYMLGAHALIDGDLGTAEERLKFALELIDHDYEALARLSVVYALQGRRDDALLALEELWNAPPHPGGPSEDEHRRGIAASFVAPFLENPDLARDPEGEWILDQLFARFGSVTDAPPVFLAQVASGRVPLFPYV